jgi:hypothetical protein
MVDQATRRELYVCMGSAQCMAQALDVFTQPPARSLPPAEEMSEKAFQAEVIRLATENGWQHWHQFDSRKSGPGWPDLVIVRPPSALFRELKRETEGPTREQVECLDYLTRCGFDAAIWRPSQLPEIRARLGSSS